MTVTLRALWGMNWRHRWYCILESLGCRLQTRFCCRCDQRNLDQPVQELEDLYGDFTTRWLCCLCAVTLVRQIRLLEGHPKRDAVTLSLIVPGRGQGRAALDYEERKFHVAFGIESPEHLEKR